MKRRRKGKRFRRNKTNYLVAYVVGISMVITLICLSLTFVVACKYADVIIYDEMINVNTGVTHADAKASFFGVDLSFLLKKTGEVDESTIGEYSVRYQMPFSKTCYSKTVYVVDKVAPEIILVGEEYVTIENLSGYVDPGVEAMDNYDGDLTTQVYKEVKQHSTYQYEMIYTVSDSSENTATISRWVFLTNTGYVYLTFDDGPSWDITPELLDLLEEKNVKATFFIVGYDEDKEEIVKRIYEDGHTLGLHGYSHDYSEIYTSVDRLLENYYTLQELVKETTGGYEAKLIRFPGGTSNTVSKRYCTGIMSEASVRVVEEGFIYYDWNVDSSDAGGADTADEIYYNVILSLQAGRNNVVLMHDSAGHDETLKAVERIIDFCRDYGFELLPITEDMTPVRHRAQN